MKFYKVDIFNIVGSEHCIEATDGEKVFKIIKKGLENGKKIIISFNNIDMITTAFLNSAIGQLYGVFDEDFIKKNISVENLKPIDKIKLKRVTDTAKAFYNNPHRMQEIVRDILGE